MRHIISQCLVAQNFKPNGINNYCYNLKRNQKPLELYKYIKIYLFMKSRCNSSNKAEKKMFEAKTVIKIKLYLTGNVL